MIVRVKLRGQSTAGDKITRPCMHTTTLGNAPTGSASDDQYFEDVVDTCQLVCCRKAARIAVIPPMDRPPKNTGTLFSWSHGSTTSCTEKLGIAQDVQYSRTFQGRVKHLEGVLCIGCA